jgi:hypothetical protein
MLGWGQAGRAAYWGGLALCDPCKDLIAVDLANRKPEDRERRCTHCRTSLKLLDGMAEAVGCPSCGSALDCATLGTWR